MLKSIGVHDGGGTIRNSTGGVDEAGCFRRPARWQAVDKQPAGSQGCDPGRAASVKTGGFHSWKNVRRTFSTGCWVDSSGPVTATAVEGVALFDHPANPGHPVAFHVRDDGWMGACLSHGRPIELARGETLRVRYGLWVHAGMPPADAVEARWREFADRPLPAAARR